MQKCDAITELFRESIGLGGRKYKRSAAVLVYLSDTRGNVAVAGRMGMPAPGHGRSGVASLKVGLADGGAQSVPELPEWVHLAGGLDDERDGEVAVLQCSTGGQYRGATHAAAG